MGRERWRLPERKLRLGPAQWPILLGGSCVGAVVPASVNPSGIRHTGRGGSWPVLLDPVSLDSAQQAAPVPIQHPRYVEPTSSPTSSLWTEPEPPRVLQLWSPTVLVLAALPADSVRRLMLDFCQALSPSDAKITRPVPAVNVRPSDAGRRRC